MQELRATALGNLFPELLQLFGVVVLRLQQVLVVQQKSAEHVSIQCLTLVHAIRRLLETE